MASVGAITPETEDSEKYEIEFSDRYATWDVVDSRGALRERSRERGGTRRDNRSNRTGYRRVSPGYFDPCHDSRPGACWETRFRGC
ncbi:hypothetical protein [Salinigranum salinum]|uniref:hypothetical protein n=1 Tax=Salinigranum salinum TaxID=1364937 RepID=UPI001864E691